LTNESERLKRELFIRATLPVLPGDVAAALSELLTPFSAPEGTVLFREGEVPEEIFFLVEGEVVLERSAEKPWVFGPHSIVGVMDATLKRPRLRSARVTQHSRFYRVRAKAWLDLLADDASLARGATVNLAAQVHDIWLSIAHSSVHRVVSSIPPPDAPISLYEKILTLRDTAMLKSAGTQAIASLAQATVEIWLADAELLFDAGAVEDTLFVVMYGVIELTRASPSVRARYGAGEVVAPTAALSGALGGYQAYSRGRSLVLRIRSEEYYDQAEAHPDLIRAALAYVMAERERLVLAKNALEARAS
jgi:CRP-like cAMP-binding protein